MLHVIEGEHRVEQHEAGLVLGFWIGRAVGSPRSLGPGIEQRWFKSRRGVVADESDRATGESRQPWDERRLEFRHEPAKTLDERLVGLARDTRSIDSRSGAALPEHEERIFSQEGITGDLLASFDALEQERVIRVLGNLEKRGHGRQQVRDDFLDDRHERSAARQFHEFVERCLFHACPLTAAT